MANLLQVKRGLVANLPVLAAGEPAFCTDTYDFYIGDGTTNHRVTSEEDFTTTLLTKLNGIEALADVTDFTNVSAALAAATAAIAVNSQKITGLATPTVDTDAATKAYADSVGSGLDVKDSVRIASTANIDLTTGTLLTIDGVLLVAGDRVLVKNQTTASENGLYVAGTGAWSRSTDADTDAEVTSGLFTFVTEGTSNKNKGFILTTVDPITVGTTSLTFTQFASSPSISSWLDLTDTPSAFTALGIVRGNTGGTALEMVAFATTYLDDTAGGTSGLTSKGATSNILYNHGVATTGVHGAGAYTLLNSGSIIDGGAF